MFRNLRIYRVNSPWPESEQELSDMLSEHSFSPCGAFSEKVAGFEAPTQVEGDALARRINGADLLQLRTQSRVLPVAAVREALEGRVAEYRTRMGEEPSRGEIRKLKEETRDELMPKALLKSDRTRAFFLLSESLLVIDATTSAKAEWVIDHLRRCFTPFDCTPLTWNTNPETLLKQIFQGRAPAGFALGHECHMQDVSDQRAIATWRDIELADESIQRHVNEGMRLTRLGIGFDEVMQCVLAEDGVISKMRFHEGDDIDRPDYESPQARQDADFVLLTGTVDRLLGGLKKSLGGYVTTS